MSNPQHGRTTIDHVEHSLREATATLIRVAAGIHGRQRIPKTKRVELWRELAGVVSDVESIRVWLDAGAPLLTGVPDERSPSP